MWKLGLSSLVFSYCSFPAHIESISPQFESSHSNSTVSRIPHVESLPADNVAPFSILPPQLPAAPNVVHTDYSDIFSYLTNSLFSVNDALRLTQLDKNSTLGDPEISAVSSSVATSKAPRVESSTLSSRNPSSAISSDGVSPQNSTAVLFPIEFQNGLTFGVERNATEQGFTNLRETDIDPLPPQGLSPVTYQNGFTKATDHFPKAEAAKEPSIVFSSLQDSLENGQSQDNSPDNQFLGNPSLTRSGSEVESKEVTEGSSTTKPKKMNEFSGPLLFKIAGICGIAGVFILLYRMCLMKLYEPTDYRAAWRQAYSKQEGSSTKIVPTILGRAQRDIEYQPL